MKKSLLTIAFFITALLVGSQLMMSCGGKTEQTTESNDQAKPDSTAVVYACSMHPEVTGKEGDKCSKCGMKLEAVKKADSTTHKH